VSFGRGSEWAAGPAGWPMSPGLLFFFSFPFSFPFAVSFCYMGYKISPLEKISMDYFLALIYF
jgi:hypothetical protein